MRSSRKPHPARVHPAAPAACSPRPRLTLLAAALAVAACQTAVPLDAAPAADQTAPVSASAPSRVRSSVPDVPAAMPPAPGGERSTTVESSAGPAGSAPTASAGAAGPTVPASAAAAAARTAPAALGTPATPAPSAGSPARLEGADDFASRAPVQDFVRDMAQRHGFAPEALDALFARARRSPDVLRLIAPAAPTFKRSWSAYRTRFLDALRIREGLRFWGEHAEALARAADRFGVPEEIVVAIIGVETVYGRNTGSFRVVDALATLAFDYPRRAEYFRGELEQYLLYTREAGIDPLSVRGSFAGAIGLPQFMPRSLRHFATDFDGDGRIDLRASPTDAIGSVARFLSMHGWQPGGRTHYPVRLEPDAAVAPLVDLGLEPRLTLAQMRPYGVQAAAGAAPPADEKLALVDLPDGDAPTVYRLGAQNFHVITRYNRSSFYAMAVIELAETLRAARARQG